MTLHYLHPSGKHLSYDPENDKWTELPEWILPKPKPSFWTTERIGLALYVWSLAFALLIGVAWGAR